MFKFLIGFFIGFMIAPDSCRAMEHGWDRNDPYVQWVESLLRPDRPPNTIWACCGKADLYEIEIIEEALGETGDAMGRARVTDGSARVFPDGTKRDPVPNGFEFRFPKSKVNPPSDGNPGRTAIAFFTFNTASGEINHLYCVVPTPPAN